MNIHFRQSSTVRSKIMIVITNGDIGGAQIHVLQILKGLGANYEFILITGKEGFLAEKARKVGVEVVICSQLVRPISPFKDLCALRSLRRLIKYHNPDLLHLHSFKAGVVGRIAARLMGVPSLFTAHGWAFTPGVSIAQRFLGLVIEAVVGRITTAIIVVSRHDYDLASRLHVVASNKLSLVHNCADLEDVSCVPDKEPVGLISLGRLMPFQKNQQMLIEMMVKLPETVTLTIVGDGPQKKQLQARVAVLGLGQRVILPGAAEDIRPYLCSSQIFVSSSDYEGLPLSILEAICTGLPVVATDVGGVREAVIDGESGYLVSRRNTQEFIERLMILIENPQRRSTMGSAARRHYMTNFTLEKFLQRTSAVYDSIIYA